MCNGMCTLPALSKLCGWSVRLHSCTHRNRPVYYVYVYELMLHEHNYICGYSIF